jgi:hypothetical protein
MITSIIFPFVIRAETRQRLTAESGAPTKMSPIKPMDSNFSDGMR